MLRQTLVHPPLLAALAAAGHGSSVLLTDANYPHSTAAAPGAARIHLNLRAGQIPVDDILETVATAIPIEKARVMQPDDGSRPPIFDRFAELLPQLELTGIARSEFYDLARSSDLAVIVASGDQRLFANILLTIGVVAPPT